MEKLTRFLKNILIVGFIGILLFAYLDFRDIGKPVTLYRDAVGQSMQEVPVDWFFYAPVIFLIVLNILISWMSKMIDGLPLKKLNLPNKAYWFEKEDRSEQLEVVLKSWIYGFAIIINLLFIVLITQIWMTNRGLGGQLYQYGLITLVFVLIFSGWIGFIFYRLRLNREEFIN